MKITLNSIEKYILNELLETDPMYYYSYSWFGYGEHSKKDLQKAMKKLREAGLVEYRKGLMDDDGMVAGSGHQITRNGHDLIENKHE